MPVRSQDPDPEDCRVTVTWGYEKILPGGKTVGFLAGHPTGAFVHDLRPSRPCRHRMTDRTMICPYCADKLAPVWKGYTPFYTQDYTRAFVLISRPVLDAVREIEPGAQIVISRDKGQKSPIIIRAQVWRSTPLPPGKPVNRNLDLMPFLVGVLWKDVELQRYHQSIASSDSDKAMSLPEVPTIIAERAGKPTRKPREPSNDGLKTMGELFPDLQAKIERESAAARKNGNHKPE